MISNKAKAGFLNGFSAQLISSKVYMKLHVGSPGTEGKSNPAEEKKVRSFTLPATLSEGEAATGLKNTEANEWVEVKAKEKYTFFSIWRNVEGLESPIEFLGYGEFSGGGVSVEVGDTFRINKEQFTITVE